MEVSNLGPLRSAEVEMADLTLLIGENNSGKTFFATVLHRILGASHPLDQPAGLSRPKPSDEVLAWIEARLTPQQGESSSLCGPDLPPTNAALQWATGIATAALKTFGADVREAIEYAYGVEASELRRRTPSRRASDCYLRIRNTDPDWEVVVRFDSDDVVVEPPDPAAWLRRLIDE